jgi:poly(3-hydroxybutyrate) depolymerase
MATSYIFQNRIYETTERNRTEKKKDSKEKKKTTKTYQNRSKTSKNRKYQNSVQGVWHTRPLAADRVRIFIGKSRWSCGSRLVNDHHNITKNKTLQIKQN